MAPIGARLLVEKDELVAGEEGEDEVAPFSELDEMRGSLDVVREELVVAAEVGAPVIEERADAAMVEVITTRDSLAVSVTVTGTTTKDMTCEN